MWTIACFITVTGNYSWSHFLYSEMWPEIVLQVLTVLQPHDRTIGKTEEEKTKEKEEGRRGGGLELALRGQISAQKRTLYF